MVDIQSENRVEVLRQVALIQDRELRRLYKRLESLIEENAQLKHQTPDELQQELIALQELLGQREQALFGDKSERRGRGHRLRRNRGRVLWGDLGATR